MAVKQVGALDPSFQLQEGATEIDPSDLRWSLNEWDEFSLEAALRIKDALLAVDVLVVGVGGEAAQDGLLACLAKGADRAVRIWDDSLGDLEPMMTSALLAEAIRDQHPDLVLCGAQSSDAASGATGVALAARLGLTRVGPVTRLELRDDRALFVDRALEGGLIETLSLPLPALVTVQRGINEPRHATLRAIKQASAKPLELRSARELGVDVDAVRGARTVALSAPSTGARARILDGDVEDVAAAIAAIVKDQVGTSTGRPR